MDPALPVAASHSHCAVSPPPLPPRGSVLPLVTGAATSAFSFGFPRFGAPLPSVFFLPSPLSPPTSTLRPVLVWGQLPFSVGQSRLPSRWGLCPGCPANTSSMGPCGKKTCCLLTACHSHSCNQPQVTSVKSWSCPQAHVFERGAS